MDNSWILLSAGSAAISLAVCLAAYPLAGLLHVLDRPGADGGRKRHQRVTPLMGGIAVALPALLAMWYLYSRTGEGFYAGLSLVTFAYLVLGYGDDRQNIKPIFRLVAASVFSALAIYYSPGLEVSFLRFSFLPLSFFLDQWAPVFTILCLVGLQNAVNMADGRNGLVPGMILIWVLLLFYYGSPNLYPLLSVLAASLVVVLGFNLKGKLFLGDAGSYSLSVLVGGLAIYAYNQGFLLITADAVALMFLVPVLDCIRLVVSRVLNGRSPFSADRNHLHHLISAAVPWGKGLPIYLSFVALPNILAILLPLWTALWAVLVVLIYVVVYTVLSRGLEGRTLA